MKTLVTGAAGFIGHWLVRYLTKTQDTDVSGIDSGHSVVGRSFHEYGLPYWLTGCDLRQWDKAKVLFGSSNKVYALAADMGGIGHITKPNDQARLMWNNALINLYTAEACLHSDVFKPKRLLFTSSVCVYPTHLLTSLCPELLTEDQAIPANPQDSYGWEKLFSEQLYTHYRSYGLETRIVRLENTYGPECQWRGGREKAPAALCRKVAHAKLTGQDSIEIWGDGEQTRTFMYVSDCVRGLVTVMESDEERPVNLGPDESVSIDHLTDLIMDSAGVDLRKVYIEGPEGVRGRNFSHERARALGWQAEVLLKDGIAKTYEWVEGEVERSLNE